jgi:BASS family bile acid:Na+ symporter
MIWVIAIVVAISADKLATVAIIVLVAVAMHNGIGLILGYGVSKAIGMEENKARAICLKSVLRCQGLAVVLAMAHFDPLAAVPGAIFSVWHNLTGGIIAGYWAKRPSTTKAVGKR